MGITTRLAPRWAIFAVTVLGCGDGGGSDDSGDVTGATSTGTAPMDTSGAATTGDDVGPESSGAVDSEDTGNTATDTSGSSTTGDGLQFCGIEDLAPGATNPLVASDRTPMQLPFEIADIITRSCGCHLADDLVIPGDYPPNGTLDLTTWPAWQSPFGTVTTYEAARRKLDPIIPDLIMPPRTCDVGDGETMLPEDRARLLEWVTGMAPDGVTWSSM